MAIIATAGIEVKYLSDLIRELQAIARSHGNPEVNIRVDASNSWYPRLTTDQNKRVVLRAGEHA